MKVKIFVVPRVPMGQSTQSTHSALWVLRVPRGKRQSTQAAQGTKKYPLATNCWSHQSFPPVWGPDDSPQAYCVTENVPKPNVPDDVSSRPVSHWRHWMNCCLYSASRMFFSETLALSSWNNQSNRHSKRSCTLSIFKTSYFSIFFKMYVKVFWEPSAQSLQSWRKKNIFRLHCKK